VPPSAFANAFGKNFISRIVTNTVAFLDPSIRSLRLSFLRLERECPFEFKFTRFSRFRRDQILKIVNCYLRKRLAQY